MGAELTDSSRNSFRTHEPANLVPDLSGYNLYSTDPPCRSRPSPGRAGSRGELLQYGELLGSEKWIRLPKLRTRTPRIECLRSAGRRIDR